MDGEPRRVQRRYPKRVRTDPAYRESVRVAGSHHLAHSDYLRRDRDDRLAEAELDAWNAECCGKCGIHPSTWSPKHGGNIRRPEYVPEWKFCKPCQLWQTAEEAGPDADDQRGWHLAWKKAEYDD